MFYKERTMKKHYFCTLFDSAYLLKGVAMLRSLKLFCPEAEVFVLCMDEECKSILGQLGLAYIHCIPLADIEDDSLLEAKKDRGVAEYCWTLSPCLPWFILQKHPEINMITYLDADLMFYSDIDPLFQEIGNASIAIIEHRFTERLKDREVNGRFCVEWVSFQRDEQGMSCLNRWREQCIEWCYYRLEDGKMGDQKYLDEWPEKYSFCHILMHPGAGIAPWNYAQYKFGYDAMGRITVQGEPLIFYHFHQFQLLINGKFDRLSAYYTDVCPEPESIYAQYEEQLKKILLEIRAIKPNFSNGLKPVTNVRWRRFIQRYVPFWLKEIARRFFRY